MAPARIKKVWRGRQNNECYLIKSRVEYIRLKIKSVTVLYVRFFQITYIMKGNLHVGGTDVEVLKEYNTAKKKRMYYLKGLLFRLLSSF